MGIPAGLGFEFEESLSGYIGVGETHYTDGYTCGEVARTRLTFEVKISISDMQSFLNISDHSAGLAGSVTFGPLGGTFPLRDGIFNLFIVDPATGMREMIYSFRFTAEDGKTYYLHGHKELKCDSSPFDVTKDMTNLYTTVYAGEDETAGVYGAGKLFFDPRDIPSMVSSMVVTGNPTWRQRWAVIMAFLSFGAGVLKEEYLKDVNPLYETRGERLILSGEVENRHGDSTNFFLASGAHDPGFPWGDGASFWDLLLIFADSSGGYRRYGITKNRLKGMRIDVEQGMYSYHGPLFEITDGYSASYSQMEQKDGRLKERSAEIEIRFDPTEHSLPPFAFPVDEHPGIAESLRSRIDSMIRDIIPTHQPLGVHMVPYTLTVQEGSLRILDRKDQRTFSIVAPKTFGEAEKTSLRNIKEPALLYGYLCGVRPHDRGVRIQVETNVMRDERQHWLKDRIDFAVGAIVSHVASKDIVIQGKSMEVRDLGQSAASPGEKEYRFKKLGKPIIELNNDQFPTAVFQRRIREVLDPSGEKCLALEEDMDLMRLNSINSGRKVIVAAIKDDDKLLALEEVLSATHFREILERKRAEADKSEKDFSIVIKPNFMFAYNVADRTTYTDPQLVERLVGLIRERGYQNVTVVEAQSTYGDYFDKRSVKEVAKYLDYDVTGDLGYKLVDLTLDDFEERNLGPNLGNHRVPLTWRDADFRISFAKNKTHSWAYYTLTLKNIYGALPLASKYKEYHVDRDIYHTTIEYLTAFPVHFGFIDAYVSADGPFGIFVDSEPNYTKTIIGGEDLVAVDWVGASKMGLDPMISTYMRLAVEQFGKPEIHFVGDRNPYRPWLNVPAVLSLFAELGLDRHEYFGNLLFLGSVYMDDTHFTFKKESPFLSRAREALKPLKEAIALQAGGTRTPANVLVGKLERMLGQ